MAVVVGELVEHLVAEVGRDMAVVTGERLDERVDVLVAAERHGRELQPRRPALGAGDQRGGVLGRQRLTGQRDEQGPGLVGVEGEIGLADLAYLVSQAQAVHREHRVDPRGDHEPQRVGTGLDEVADLAPQGRAREPVEVLDHQDADPRGGEVEEAVRVPWWGRLGGRWGERRGVRRGAEG